MYGVPTTATYILSCERSISIPHKLISAIFIRATTGRPYSRIDICPYSRIDICPYSRMDICPYSRMDICPYSRMDACSYMDKVL